MNQKKCRILCVEDHEDTCEIITYTLDDYEVISAGTKFEAIKRAKESDFCLYILDYHLPDGTGFELCKQIRTFDDRTPVLFVTGTSFVGEVSARSVGAQGLLKKTRSDFIKELRIRVSDLCPN